MKPIHVTITIDVTIGPRCPAGESAATFKEIVIDLLNSGLTEKAIGGRVGLSQASINRIKLGKQRDINYAAGKGLIDLHGEVCPSSGQAAGEPVVERAA